MIAAAGEMIRRAPDMVLLQEVWFQEDAALLVEQFGSDYDSIDVPRGALLGRKGGLLAFLRKSSVFSTERRVARYEPFSTAASPLIFWQGDGLGEKGIQVIDLRHRDSGQSLFVLNTHLQAQYGNDTYSEIRRSQISQLAAVATSLDASAPVLAAGDLNTLPAETTVYAQITGTWTDLTTILREQCGCGTAVHAPSLPAADKEEWIDYVLARRGGAWDFAAQVEPIRNVGVDDPFSDHDGLDATIDIRNTGSASLTTRALAALVLRGPSSRRAWLTAGAALVLDRLWRVRCADG